jgi:hypothetical protein
LKDHLEQPRVITAPTNAAQRKHDDAPLDSKRHSGSLGGP